MNVVLAEVRSLNINTANGDDSPETDSDKFPDLIKNSLEGYPDVSEQVVENKQQIVESTGLKAIDDAVIPLSWVASLSAARVTDVTDSDPAAVTLVEPSKSVTGTIHSADKNSHLIKPDHALAKGVVGEPLPVDGKVMPLNGELMSKLPLTDSGLTDSGKLIQALDPPVTKSTEASVELDIRKFQKPGLMRDDGRMFAPRTDPNPIARFDTLVESIPAKVLETQSGHNNLVDSAVARPFATTQIGALTNLQGNYSLSTPTEPLYIARPDSPVEWSQGLGDRVSWMINQKLNSATIRLDPPSLGKLEIHVQVTDEATKITINVQTAQTRDLIENASMRLRDLLQEAGYPNVDVDVGHDRSQPQFGAQHNASTITESSKNVDSNQEISDDLGPNTGRYYRLDSLVDTFV